MRKGHSIVYHDLFCMKQVCFWCHESIYYERQHNISSIFSAKRSCSMFRCAGFFFFFSKFSSSRNVDIIKKITFQKKKKKLYKLLIAGFNPIYHPLILKLQVYSSITFYSFITLPYNGIMVNTFCRV